MPHELTAALRAAGLPLASTLEDMLDEQPSHRTERRGCGYTQASRHLSCLVNELGAASSTQDLSIFARWPQHETAALAAQLIERGWQPGWRRLHQAPDALFAGMDQPPLLARLRTLDSQLRSIRPMLERAESLLVVDLVGHVLERKLGHLPTVPGMPEKPQIGSCSQAEEYFLEIAHGKVRRGGQVNLFVDSGGTPLLVEKIGLGESHSAITLAPIGINEVGIPPGSLLALRPADDAQVITATRHGRCMPLAAIAQARFLRLTTLAVPPAIRRRAFSAQIDAQVRGNLLSPLTTTLDELRSFAHKELGG
ncbi:MAG: hypothetical protein K8F35_07785 [Dokdonella sp.]|uniref:hypothetical protein n=1 Tax=Dokdonella sp. TaxID=2291710 RepID=UPI0025B983E3|nr:hypothetical protein [Dokdonella sp.]MBZ0222916.1 hypothetical protein [Dokdonella sp.]